MAIKSRNVSVGTTATLLSQTDAGGSGQTVVVKSPSSASVTVYLGGSDVTADTTAGTGGYPIAAGGELAVFLSAGDVLYGRVASGTQTVNVLNVGV